jgi:cell division transport system permease protein
LGGNPLVDALRIQVNSPNTLADVAATLDKITGVDEIYYSDQVVKQLGQLQDTLRLGSVGLTGILTLTTVAVITTTIRLIVMARRREIEVMQLVGATSTWIYLPFILQGFLFGLIGSGFACGLILGSQHLLQDLLQQLIAFPFLQIPRTTHDLGFWLLPLVLIGLGTLLGTTSSLIAVRKSAGR